MIPLQLFVAALVGGLQGDQHTVIQYLREENRVLKAQLQNQRLRLTDGDRRRLAARGAALGRRLLAQVAELSPRTFCTFRRELSSLRRTISRRRTPRHVLEELSGESEWPMIIPHDDHGPQQRYDHRLRGLV